MFNRNLWVILRQCLLWVCRQLDSRPGGAFAHRARLVGGGVIAFSERRCASLSNAGCAVSVIFKRSRRRKSAAGERMRSRLVHQFEWALRASARSGPSDTCWG
jgi:hypothetical protein